MKDGHFLLFAVILSVFSFSCTNDKVKETLVYESEHLEIYQIGEHVFRHVSFLNNDQYKDVPCNGMIATGNSEAIVIDTPVDPQSSGELLKWLVNERNLKIRTVVATHFHVDCLGGLEEFHEMNIPSYGFERTLELAAKNDLPSPLYGFKSALRLNIGDNKVRCQFIDEGHTTDNIIVYFPTEKTLFGGCLIKAKGAGKGNVEDANLTAWPETVRAIQNRFTDIEVIIPGHGQPGRKDLLDYTIDLFSTEN